jgi:hypothetical protein
MASCHVEPKESHADKGDSTRPIVGARVPSRREGVPPFRAVRASAVESFADNDYMDGVLSDGAIEVVNKYQWVGSPRQGRFRVSIDGKAAGFAPLQSSLRAVVSPGSHTVRISLWNWYWSQRADVEVPEGSTVVLKGDIDRSSPVLRRMAHMLFRPHSCLMLQMEAVSPSDEQADARQYEAVVQSQGRHSPQLLFAALTQVAGFLLIAVGAAAWPIAILGLVMVVVGFVWALRSMRARRRVLTT